MSKSKSGTRTTAPSINNDSPKYVERSTLGQKKTGSVADGTDAAHKFSFGLMNTIETRSSGAAQQETSRKQLVREMNHDDNLRIKSDYGNRVLDERRDGRIANAYVEGTPLQGKSTVARAEQAYKAAQGLTNDKYARELGEMRVLNEDTGRTHKLKNHDKY